MHCVEDVVYRSGDNKTTIAQRSNTVDSNVFGLNYAIQVGRFRCVLLLKN